MSESFDDLVLLASVSDRTLSQPDKKEIPSLPNPAPKNPDIIKPINSKASNIRVTTKGLSVQFKPPTPAPLPHLEEVASQSLPPLQETSPPSNQNSVPPLVEEQINVAINVSQDVSHLDMKPANVLNTPSLSSNFVFSTIENSSAEPNVVPTGQGPNQHFPPSSEMDEAMELAQTSQLELNTKALPQTEFIQPGSNIPDSFPPLTENIPQETQLVEPNQILSPPVSLELPQMDENLQTISDAPQITEPNQILSPSVSLELPQITENIPVTNFTQTSSLPNETYDQLSPQREEAFSPQIQSLPMTETQTQEDVFGQFQDSGVQSTFTIPQDQISNPPLNSTSVQLNQPQFFNQPSISECSLSSPPVPYDPSEPTDDISVVPMASSTFGLQSTDVSTLSFQLRTGTIINPNEPPSSLLPQNSSDQSTQMDCT